jgi:hypothetical protein
MSYEHIIELEMKEAQLVLDVLHEEGPHGLMEELRIYHWPGHHEIVSDAQLLIFGPHDVLYDDGPYLAWVNHEELVVGLAYKLLH